MRLRVGKEVCRAERELQVCLPVSRLILMDRG